MFWLEKVSAACEMELETVVAKPSMLAAAVLPAMAAAPKELMADWMSTLEMENMLLCSPAGMPMRRIIESERRSMRVFFGSKRTSPWLVMRLASTSAALMVSLTTVAMATPATPSLSPATSATLRTTLTRPLTVR